MALVDFDDLFEPVNSNLITIEDCLRAGSKGVFISNEHYHALDGISGSNLPLLAISNKHLDEKHLFSLASAPPLVRGTLYHTLVLEPDSVFDRYVVMPSKFLGKAYGGKTIIEQKKEFHAANNNKIIIDHVDIFNDRFVGLRKHTNDLTGFTLVFTGHHHHCIVSSYS